MYDFVFYDDKYIERPADLKAFQLDSNTTFYDYFFSRSEKGYLSVKNLKTSEIIEIDRSFNSVSYNDLNYPISENGSINGGPSTPWFHTIFNDGNKDFLVLTHLNSLLQGNSYVIST